MALSLTSEIAPQNVHRAVEKMHALYSDVIETFFEQDMPIFEELVSWKYEEAAVITVTLQEGKILVTHPLMYTSDPPSQWVVKDIFSHLTQSLADYCAIDRRYTLEQELTIVLLQNIFNDNYWGDGRSLEIISRGADLNPREGDLGRTPLLEAASSGNKVVFMRLLSLGADPTIRDNGQMGIMHCAAQGGSLEIFNAVVNNIEAGRVNMSAVDAWQEPCTYCHRFLDKNVLGGKAAIQCVQSLLAIVDRSISIDDRCSGCIWPDSLDASVRKEE